MSSNFSPVLYPDVGEQQNPGATACYNSTLYYIGNGHNSKIWVLTRSLGSLDPNENPDLESSYWTQTLLDELPSFDDYAADTNRQPGAAVAGGNLFFVWVQDDANDNQPSGSVWATQLTVDKSGQGTTWSQPVRLCDTWGSPLEIDGANFALMDWGDYLIGCFNSVGAESGPQFLVYDTGDWPALPQNTPSSWSAVAGWSSSFADFPNFPPPGQLGNQVSMGWFATAGTPPTATTPAMYCIVSFFNASTGTAYVLHMMNILPFDQWPPGAQPFEAWMVEQWTNVSSGVNIIRDPAGRMRAYHLDGSNNINVRVLATDAISSDGYTWTQFAAPALLYNQSIAAQMIPVPAFVLGTAQKSTTSDGKKKTVWQVYEFVIFPPQGHEHIYLVFSNFGKAVEIADAYQMPFDTVVPAAEQKLVVTGLIDSPLPMPAVNVASRPTPYNNQTIGSVTYGAVTSTTDSRTTSWSWSAGFISSGKSTKGAGPAWNISFSAGTQGATSASSATQLGTQWAGLTNVDLAAERLVPDGAFFYAAVEYHRDEYTFYDLSLDGTTYTQATYSQVGDAPPKGNAPQVTAVWIEYIGLGTQSFTPYANTVGNIWSYTQNGWNARMQQLGYPGDNYFDDVIALQDQDGHYVNAVLFGANPYLQFSWALNSIITNNYNAVQTDITESGWHLDASAYAGISWGAGVSFFGIGENQMGELLVGGSYSRTTQETTTDGSSWGINVTYGLQDPPPQLYPGGVTALNWRLWLLTANAQWADELVKHGNLPSWTHIDPGSELWRIVFEVVPESVVFQGDNKNLVYCAANGEIVEAWYNPGCPYSFSELGKTEVQGTWGWTSLTQAATAAAGSGGTLPNAVGTPCWFAWGLDQPGYLPYAQAVAFRSATGDILLLRGAQWPVAATAPPPPPDNTAWQWRSLAPTPGFVQAAGDPVGFYWQNSPSGHPEIHIFYRGVDGDIHELWALDTDAPNWRANNLTASFPQAQKPASDPCAVVWDEDPGGPSEHVFYRGNDDKIHELYYESKTSLWGQTDLSQATGDGATPEGKPGAFVWNASLHVGYRGSTGEIHELRRQDNNWQPADDPSWDAHATAPDQRAAAVPVCGLAWLRRTVPQTIHWFYVTVDGAVAELYRYDAAANSWKWNNLSEQATGAGNSGALPPVVELLQGNAWYFDPVHGSSMQLYLRDQNGAIYELCYLPDAPSSQDGAWEWRELTGWVTDSNGNPLPAAPSGG